MMDDKIRLAKQKAAERAVAYVKSGMIVGMGTGSTAYFANRLLGEKHKQGFDIRGVPTSRDTQELARSYNIEIVENFDRIDISIDGADEVDERGDLIKGGGGALTREKIVASASRCRIIVCDDSKLVSCLGKFPLPVEVLPFGWQRTASVLSELGCKWSVRQQDGQIYISDNGNYVLNCSFERIADAAALAGQINMIPGVVENGLFCSLTDRVIYAGIDGDVKEKIFTAD
jgi:ribose 5-phosphate isomerase A